MNIYILDLLMNNESYLVMVYFRYSVARPVDTQTLDKPKTTPMSDIVSIHLKIE
jgi:hypothetical protein